jgi:glycine/D-amino acid oxidase-like deaminating enzyme
MWPATTALLLGLVAAAQRSGTLVSASLTGALSLATSRAAAHHLAREARARTAVGVRAEIWDPAQVAERTGGRLRTAGVQAALWLPDEGRLDPISLLADLAHQARAAGVVCVGGARVLECEERRPPEAARGGWRLRLEGAPPLEARGLVVADGPTLHATARIYAMAFAADFPDDFPLFWDAAPYVYYDYRPGGGRLGISGGRYAHAGAAHRDTHHHARMAEAARGWLPELIDRAPTHAWAVDLAVAPGMLPRTRELGKWAPSMAVEGLGALGVLPGMYHGRRAGASVARRAQ